MIDLSILYMRVKVVMLPLPPTPVDGMIYLDDAFVSKSFDSGFDRPESVRVEKTIPTEFGPAILGSIKINDLMEIFSSKALYEPIRDVGLYPPVAGERPKISIKRATLCATSSSYQQTIHGTEYAIDITLDGIRLCHRSCHPGSHIVVPNAPFLTALLQYSSAREFGELNDNDRDFTKYNYLSPEQGAALFPYIDFSKNLYIDQYIGECTTDSDLRMYKVIGLGQWAQPYLKRLRINSIVPVGT